MESQNTHNIKVLLCAPSHDRLTRFTSALFDGIPDLGAPTVLYKIVQPTAYDQLLDTLPHGRTTKVALIFAGHGTPTSLLGPGVNQDSTNYEKTFSCFYDDSFLNIGPKIMLAFCCSAGADLGESFRPTKGRTFMGFDQPIGFVMQDGVYIDWWRTILHRSTLEVIHAETPQKIEVVVKGLYRSALSYFSSPQGRKKQWALWMRMTLRHQMNALRIIKT